MPKPAAREATITTGDVAGEIIVVLYGAGREIGRIRYATLPEAEAAVTRWLAVGGR